MRKRKNRAIEWRLIGFSAPIVVAIFLQLAYDVIDTIYIGMLGAEELAAISVSFPVIFVFIAIAAGMGIGANALIAQSVGRKDLRTATMLSEHALFLGVVGALILGLLSIVFAPQLFSFMGAEGRVLKLTIEYSTPIFFGLVFLFSWFVSDAILKSQGNSKTSLNSLAASVALNVVLDPLLIFGLGGLPALGLQGAAIATVLSRTVAVILNFAYIFKRSSIKPSLAGFKPRIGCIRNILVVGLPAASSKMLSASGFILLTAVVGSFGSYALAAFGIGMRINSIVIMPLIGITSGLVSLVGQDIGSGNIERAKRTTWIATYLCLAYAFTFAAIVMFVPEWLLRVFTSDEAVITIGITYFQIVPLAYILYATYFSFIGAFQGAGKTYLALATNIAYWMVAILLAYILASQIGLTGVWWGIVSAAAVETVLVMIIYRSNIWLKREKTPIQAKC
jgi:putative MATE family efflux protein